ncbi:MAG: diguanylate cyclase [Chloroflexi bacterium]|nr:diguanylate cyclase [Chloroflexota bacterium]
MNQTDSPDRVNSVTGLYAQPLLETLLTHEVARAKRYPVPLALIRLAIKVPPNWKAGTAESAAVAIASVLNSNLRVADVPGHYENDFLIILPVTDEAGGVKVASRLMALLSAGQMAPDGGKLALDICIGLTAIPEESIIPSDAFLSQATAALTEARRRGARAVVRYSELPAS